MITIKNRLQKNSFSSEKCRITAQKILTHLGYEGFDLGIWMCSPATIKNYNAQYRNKNKVTDVLSFPYHPELGAGKKIKVTCEEDKNLGDLLICPDYVAQAADKLGSTFEQRMNRMLVHGICHLLGYDHIIDADFAKMIKKEKEVATACKIDCCWL